MQAEHAEPNVVVGAGVGEARRLNRNRARQFAVRNRVCESVAFPSPSCEIDGLRLPSGDLEAEIAIQIHRDTKRGIASAELVDDAYVPNLMEIGLKQFASHVGFHRKGAQKFDGYTVAAQVVIRDVVEGLMNVADQVNDETKRIGPSRSRGTRVFENPELLFKRADDAASRRWTISEEPATMRAAGNVNKVPRARFGIDAAVVVGPGGRIDEGIGIALAAVTRKAWVDRAGREDFDSRGSCMGTQIRLSDVGDDLMAFAAPGERRGANCERERKSRKQDKNGDPKCAHVGAETTKKVAYWQYKLKWPQSRTGSDVRVQTRLVRAVTNKSSIFLSRGGERVRIDRGAIGD
jgi:hypothetical protein